jgi:short-subunit dehydrogenase
MARPRKILVFGATSAIAYEVTKLFAKEGAALYLCARDEQELQRLCGDLRVRGAGEVKYSVFDARTAETAIAAIEKCLSVFPDLDGLLVAHGILPDQALCESDVDVMTAAMEINFLNPAAILTRLAPHFEGLKQGTIAVISSVAGDRGRQSNYVYGAAKGALSVFLSGLRQRLHKAGVRVLTIKPGFVDTPMTEHFKKGLLFVGPEVIAKGIYRAMDQNKDVVYLPWFWQGIMLIIRNIPESVFKKLKL